MKNKLEGRKTKLGSIVEVLEFIEDGILLAIGGHVYFNKPSFLVRQIAKKGVRNLSLITSPYASYDVDLLVGVKAVKATFVGNVGFEYMGLAPNFRYAVEQGVIEDNVCDESTLIGALMATAEGIPYHPIVSIRGSDVLKASPLAEEYTAPTGDNLIAVKAISPDVAILHAQASDEYGNIIYENNPWFDPLIAKASKKVIVTVDKIISNAEVRRNTHKVAIPGFLVDKVVHVPFGAHPCLSLPNYVHDEEHILDYIFKSRRSHAGETENNFESYLQEFVYEPENIYEYLKRIDMKKLLEPINY